MLEDGVYCWGLTLVRPAMAGVGEAYQGLGRGHACPFRRPNLSYIALGPMCGAFCVSFTRFRNTRLIEETCNMQERRR